MASIVTQKVLSDGRVGRGAHAGSLARKGAWAGLGLAGLLLGGLPLLLARRILYPPWVVQLPPEEADALEISVEVRPEKVEFVARDGKKLSAWFVPAPASIVGPWPCVLLVHGYGGHKEQMVRYGQMLHDGGFAVLMFDMAGSGLRYGEPITLGYKERWHVMDAVRYLRTRTDVDARRLGVLGVSMGAATALLAAAEDLSIKAIVADSAYATLTDMIKPGIRAFLGRPALVLAPLIVRYAETMLGMRSSEIRPEEAAGQLGERPVLVIHGEDDPLTDVASAHRIYAAVPGPKELWVVPDCEHAYGPVVAEQEYKQRINAFFARWL
ncbi:MAG TPA: alpha/beta fold hydrolase [Chloroflexia bacterium]|nr:alpha/beta fold hydrolase [Chloroflexia bacterium]